MLTQIASMIAARRAGGGMRERGAEITHGRGYGWPSKGGSEGGVGAPSAKTGRPVVGQGGARKTPVPANAPPR